MTCIAAVVDKGTVYIGGDGRGMSGWDIYPQTEPKVFRISDMVFGHTGSLRVQQCAQYGLMGLVPRGTLSERVYMVTCVAETLRESLKIGGCLATKDGVESFEGALLAGYRGKLYVVSSDFSVTALARDVMAVGAGSDYALGALAVSANEAPVARIEAALRTAAEFNASVGPPYTIVASYADSPITELVWNT